MNIAEICPCPNLACPNHGDCASCVSRHLKQGYPTYCGFRTMEPFLAQAAAAAPDSASAAMLNQFLDKLNQTYARLMEANGLDPTENKALVEKVRCYSSH